MRALTTLTLLALAGVGCADQLVDPNQEGSELLPTPEPVFAKHGGSEKIVFSRDHDIYIMEADGSKQNRLTFLGADGDPALSPDGRTIVFRTDRDGNSEIYGMDIRTGSLANLTAHPGYDAAPAWSPDGKHIVFVTSRDGDPEIYIMDADGSNQTRVTFDTADDLKPTWSPDGTQIAFQSNRNDHFFDIYTMDPKGLNLVRLTYYGLTDDQDPDWSSDGSKILFASNRDGNMDIYIMNSNGSRQARLTTAPALDFQPSFSPDGTGMVFVSTRGGNWDIYFRSTDPMSTGVKLHTESPDADANPDWVGY